MNGVADYRTTITVDGERYDVWESRDDGSLYISEFCQDELKEPGPGQRRIIEDAL